MPTSPTDKITDHFTLSEFLRSATAAARGIDNSPTPEVRANLHRLAEVLETVRAGLGGYPMTITSGYRSPALNEAVNGAGSAAARAINPNSRPSAHTYGLAADFICPGAGTPQALVQKISAMSDVPFQQLINERDQYGNVWVHLAIPAEGQSAGRQVFDAFQQARTSS